jgi:RNA polymerase sigma-70 factor, ECF subfamily
VGGQEPDEQLVRRHLDGDARAFEELVVRHRTRIYNACLRVLGDPEDAQDAAQETFLSALRTLDRFRGDAALTTWLHRIAVNACYDRLRKKRREPMLHLALDHDDARPPDPGPPQPDHADEVAGTADVAAALARVPAEFRVAIVLADVQDLPYEQIARILGVAVGTVKSRVHRGRIALARELTGGGTNDEPRRPGAAAREPGGELGPSEERG